MIDCIRYSASLLLVMALLAAGTLAAQSEAESSTSVLEVRANAMVNKLRHSYEVGNRVKVQLDSADAWTRGRIQQIGDSSLTLGKATVPIAHITRIKSHPDAGNVILGNFLALLMLGAGFATGLLIKTIVDRQPLKWYQWVLFCAAAVVCVLLVPVFFVGAVVTWAFASRDYEIGSASRLEVRHPKKD
jgi:hypothetical protein